MHFLFVFVVAAVSTAVEMHLPIDDVVALVQLKPHVLSFPSTIVVQHRNSTVRTTIRIVELQLYNELNHCI